MKRLLLVFLALGIGAAPLVSCRQGLAPAADPVSEADEERLTEKFTHGGGAYAFIFKNGQTITANIDGYGMVRGSGTVIRVEWTDVPNGADVAKPLRDAFSAAGLAPRYDEQRQSGMGWYPDETVTLHIRFDTVWLYGVRNAAGETDYAITPYRNDSRLPKWRWTEWVKRKPDVPDMRFDGDVLFNTGTVDYIYDEFRRKLTIIDGIELTAIEANLKRLGYAMTEVEYHPNIFTVAGNGKSWHGAIRDYRSDSGGLVLSSDCFAFSKHPGAPIPPTRKTPIAFEHRERGFGWVFPKGGYIGQDDEFWYVEDDRGGVMVGFTYEARGVMTGFTYETGHETKTDMGPTQYIWRERDTGNVLLAYRFDSYQYPSGYNGVKYYGYCFPQSAWTLQGFTRDQK